MRVFRVSCLCIALFLPGCGTADSDVAQQDVPQQDVPQHRADQPDDVEQRANLVRDVAYHMRRAAPETGIAEVDPAILEAMAEVPRHAFVPPELKPFAYLDIPLPVDRDQNTAQPFLIALMTQLAAIKPDDIVFETGTGGGYHAAILSRLARKVYSVDVLAPLAARAADTLKTLGYTNVEVEARDGFYGWPQKGPFDVIMVKEAVREVPAPLLHHLAEGRAHDEDADRDRHHREAGEQDAERGDDRLEPRPLLVDRVRRCHHLDLGPERRTDRRRVHPRIGIGSAATPP